MSAGRWKPCKVPGCGRETRALAGVPKKPDDMCLSHWTAQGARRRDEEVGGRMIADAMVEPPLAITGPGGDFTREIRG